ncbi:Smc5-6 complex non-SMC subunit 1 [Schizosaccharomyces octosporus yFS286]|uniref:Non-structural maintenance of chromosomes element 1 homolog n=1 Tax=Schizosaccharomyces octosporus (strain yFS286) TaxID=483514 RepID=S9QXB8_SCHOY|nr:Smc5-6 complex non-SMC subunit 1 [Schizosaccharomyces octosporus yFS286]EPX70950.1 Smc5-6 complex non-SMC subunit 1 [Schizosaccharomyces octosporus yFS286]
MEGDTRIEETAEKQKFVLQYVMNRTFGVDEDVLQGLIQDLFGESASLSHIMNEINKNIHNYDFKLQKIQDQLDGRPTWHFQNVSGDPVSQMATPYSTSQIELMRRIIDWIMRADEYQYSIGTLQIHKYARRDLSLAPSVVEAYLSAFERDGWLNHREGVWTFTNHALVDMEAYLHNEYESSLYECNACRGIVTAGYVCECGYCLHVYCCKHLAYVSCPNCETSWTEATKIGRW